jgi:hypothetical protein
VVLRSAITFALFGLQIREQFVCATLDLREFDFGAFS